VSILVTADATHYICDVCGAEVNQDEGVMCPTCEQIFCLRCQADHPIELVQVRKTGPQYTQREYMCAACKAAWRAAHPEFQEVQLDAYLIQT
jgi:hypothetical protein